MLVIQNDRGYRLDYMNEDDLRSLRCLIKSGGLVEGRKWYGVMKEIDETLRDR